MLTIRSHSHDYTVENFTALKAALESISARDRACYVVDQGFAHHHYSAIQAYIPVDRTIYVRADEEQKSLEALAPLFVAVLQRGFKRNGVLVVMGGGVVQDVGCFMATVLFRGVRWELIPTTLLAQADSCIGSKSSINIGPYKNQIGTFYPPHRVLLVPAVLPSLPWDEIRSGLGEVIKLQLLSSEDGFRELMRDLQRFELQPEMLTKWINRSLEVKKTYIEADEHDHGIRNLLNYGHTFGHAYESATQYGIPHGIAVILGMLTAAYLSAQLRLVPSAHFEELKEWLTPWHQPYGRVLQKASRDSVFQAIKHDKKNTGDAVNCILTRGFGRMERCSVALALEITKYVNRFIDVELEER